MKDTSRGEYLPPHGVNTVHQHGCVVRMRVCNRTLAQPSTIGHRQVLPQYQEPGTSAFLTGGSDEHPTTVLGVGRQR